MSRAKGILSEPATFEKQVYKSINQADKALKKNRIVNLELTKMMNKHKSQ